ncbi:diguanylate cyclase domain-containing protein [Pseudomarimonas salicorniae]|uniref:Diguanylate cyclase n=1 Tax=Pseudomarimonas salicorniae TaxID=2933270 RepID=A0ABT0GCF4_9GAMM|nr:diguanylate cyclase [Lysobacter sp. CAU 1642]MCK7592223.1 diguanylate cyclase [Lysobacter sp. CAU 1642]
MQDQAPIRERERPAEASGEAAALSGLRHLHDVHAALLGEISDAVILCSADGRVQRLNPAAEKLLGDGARQALGQTLDKVLNLVDAEGAPLRLDPTLPYRSDPPATSGAPRLRCPDGRLRDISLTLLPLRDGGHLHASLLVIRDVSEAQRASRQLQHEAEHDALTGLANRRALLRRLRDLMAGDTAGPHAVLFVDLDHFKAVNDHAGHAAGDELLRELSARLRPLVRRGDLLVRFGGDEFVLLLPECGMEVAERIAESLRQTVDALDFHWQGQSYRVTASVGALDFFSDEMDAEQLLAEVDAACYAAKRGGRNRVSTVSAAAADAAVHAGLDELRDLLQAATASGALALDAQRLLPSRGNEAGPLELLLRLPCGQDGGQRLRAAQVLGMAAQLRLVPRIDSWVLDRAWALLDRHPGLRLQLNLGEQTLRSSDYSQALLARLESDPTRAARLLFEIGEDVLVGGYPHSFEFARQIHRSGARIGVDRFRGGVAAIEGLRRLPLSQLKLDARMVRAGAADLIDRAMVESAVRLAEALGADSVACGIESPADADWLAAAGVRWLQGHHLHIPEPLEALLAQGPALSAGSGGPR